MFASHTAEDAAALPLALYQSLRQKLDALAELHATEANPADKDPVAAAQAVVKLSLTLQAEVRAHQARLLAALSAYQAVQRQLAARLLHYSTEKTPAVAALVTALKKETDAGVRAALAGSLGLLGDAAAVEALLAALDDEHEEVRDQCIAALGAIRDDRAVPPLMKALAADRRPLLRMHAAVALGRIRTGVNESDLTALMQREADERVRMVIAAAIRAVAGGEALEDIPDPDDFSRRLSSISDDMKRVEQKLRDDHHDEIVQLDQADVDRKISDMIDELERMQRTPVEEQKDTSKEDRKKRRLAMQRPGETQRNQMPRPDSRPGAQELDGRVAPSEVTARKERWASLPPKSRDELLQTYHADVPVRWRKRLEAYFVSLAAEEARAGRETTTKP